MGIDFTEELLDLLNHPPNDHARVLAGPGTGKSTAIIEYASRLVKKEFTGLRLLTFTRAATKELEERIPEAHEAKLRPITIHSFAISLVLRNPGTAYIPTPLRVMGDWEWETLLRPRLTKLMRLGRQWRDADTLRKEMAAKWQSLSEEETEGIDLQTRAQFVSQWQIHRELFGYVELSEIPYLLYSGLRSHPDFDIGDLKLLIIDEYQDLNACDLACIDQLSKRSITIFAVGDDDQSIYSFRKAHPAGIRQFPQQYVAPSYPLTLAHRFGKNIFSWANYVINFDSGRNTCKPSITPKENNPDGFVAYLEFKGQTAETTGIVELARWLHEKACVPFEEILVLGRTKTITIPILAAMKQADIQATDPDIIKKEFRTDGMREAMSILRLLTHKHDSLSWWTLLDLAPGVGKAKIQALIDKANESNQRFGNTILNLHQNNELKNLTGTNVLEKVSSVLGLLEKIDVTENRQWGEWILELVSEGLIPEIPDTIAEYLAEIDSLLESDVTLDSFVSQIQPICKDLSTRKKENWLRVMTMTGSKGLTVKACIVAGCESDIIPLPTGIRNEECRLLYVAMTRAREYLFLTRALRRTGTTARAGRTRVRTPRTGCPFLEHGPENPKPGEQFIEELWKADPL